MNTEGEMHRFDDCHVLWVPHKAVGSSTLLCSFRGAQKRIATLGMLCDITGSNVKITRIMTTLEFIDKESRTVLNLFKVETEPPAECS